VTLLLVLQDILFDARTNAAKKFVLHTNYPGHYNFNSYHRCHFQLPIQPSTADMARQQTGGGEPVILTPFSTWEEVAAVLKGQHNEDGRGTPFEATINMPPLQAPRLIVR